MSASRIHSSLNRTSGSANMLFTVTLTAPAPAGGASVDFTTVNQAPALNHAQAPQDYTATAGTVNFAQGEQIKTIAVPIWRTTRMPNKTKRSWSCFLIQ
jgi:sensor domain CHASE-containing protein